MVRHGAAGRGPVRVVAMARSVVALRAVEGVANLIRSRPEVYVHDVTGKVQGACTGRAHHWCCAVLGSRSAATGCRSRSGCRRPRREAAAQRWAHQPSRTGAKTDPTPCSQPGYPWASLTKEPLMGAAWRVGAVVGAMALLTGVLASSESSGTTMPAKTSFVAAAQVAVRPSAPGAFVSLAPSRLLDTRTGDGGAGPVAGSGTVHLQVAGRSGVPASGVSAVVMNVTVTSPTRTGYLTAYPDATSRPNASNLNFVQGQTVANLVTVRLGANGKVALTNVSRGSAQLVADVAGYYLVGTPPFVTSIAPSGHYFLDQYSDPILIKGDSPWIGFAAVSTTDWSAYLAARAAQGVNSLIVDAVAWNLIRGAGVPGSPDAYTAGQTYDGIHPFTNNDITTPNPTYWSRVDAMVAAARTYGITLFIYAVDNYQFGAGEVMNGVSDSSAVTLGRFLGNRYKNAPNIVWLFGNDYPPSAAPDSRMRSVLTGIRDAGDHHMFSASLMYH